MITFFLHGWNTKKLSELNLQFFHDCVESSPSVGIKILCVYFSRKERDISKLFEEDISQFLRANLDKKLTFEIAKTDEKEFIQQVKEAHIVYIKWWNTLKLKNTLENFSHLKKVFDEKIIAGSSAWALVWASYFYENDTHNAHKWLWWFDEKIFCHFSTEKNQEVQKLRDFWESRDIITIEEEKYILKYL